MSALAPPPPPPLSASTVLAYADEDLIPAEDGWKPAPYLPATRVFNTRAAVPKLVMVLDEAMSDDLAAVAYKHTAAMPRPWGCYHRRAVVMGPEDAVPPSLRLDRYETTADEKTRNEIVGLHALRALWRGPARGVIQAELERVHGFAVWALASDPDKAVSYHLDYAEMSRLDNNVIHPPLYGATMHPSPIQPGGMVGGMFAANTRGIAHYREFGHRLSLVKGQPKAFDENFARDSAWVKVPYRHKRAIVIGGTLPHLSTSVSTLPEGIKRVVIGINAFDHKIGPAVEKIPIHSKAFQRANKLRTTLKQLKSAEGAAADTSSSARKDGSLDIRAIARNKDHPMHGFMLQMAKMMRKTRREEKEKEEASSRGEDEGGGGGGAGLRRGGGGGGGSGGEKKENAAAAAKTGTNK